LQYSHPSYKILYATVDSGDPTAISQCETFEKAIFRGHESTEIAMKLAPTGATVAPTTETVGSRQGSRPVPWFHWRVRGRPGSQVCAAGRASR
ncbi:MAG: hypothetical protein M0Z30_06875, partial [Actinomycetota bacterium]|nr:hypothetical protein [Actinomycetota bacterium]